MQSKNELVALIIDDMKVARIKLIEACRLAGIPKIIEATNGREAWNYMAKENLVPSIILSDFNMPDMNGLEFLELVRGSKSTESVPVIFVTAEAEKKFIFQAVSTGVTEIIIKPYDNKALVEKIESVLKKS